MQDLSVDKTVDSVNKTKWTQMGVNGIIVKYLFYITLLCKTSVLYGDFSFFVSGSRGGHAHIFHKTLAQRKKYVTIGSYERQI